MMKPKLDKFFRNHMFEGRLLLFFYGDESELKYYLVDERLIQTIF